MEWYQSRKDRTIYQLGPKPTILEQDRIWILRRMALVAISFEGPASSSFNNLSETEMIPEIVFFSIKFLKQFDSATIKIEPEAEAQNIQQATQESISIYACRVEGVLTKGWPELDSK